MNPPVFRDYTLSELDEQFDLRARHPNFQEYFDRNDLESANARKRLEGSIDAPYGRHPLQRLDAFAAERPDSPIVVFAHGGYWRALDKANYSFVANAFSPRPCATFVVNYRLAPEVGIESILEDLASSLRWIRQNATQYNGNPNALYLVGHSAGAHLALMAAILQQREDAALHASLQGLLSISGLFDLEPVRLSFLNETLGINPSIAAACSPAQSPAYRSHFPMIFAAGGKETDEFIRQSQAMSEILASGGNESTFKLLPDLNHFDILYECNRPSGQLAQALLSMIGSF